MKKIVLVVTMLLAVSTTAQAEFILGVQGGYNKVNSEKGGEFGVYGQYRWAVSGDSYFGLHVGYAKNQVEDKSNVTVGNLSLTGTSELDAGIDLLAVYGKTGQKVNPFVMFGYSTLEFDLDGIITDSSNASTNRLSSDETLKGWKLGAGLEMPINEKTAWHVMADYSDYGDENITVSIAGVESVTVKNDFDRTAVRIGLAYRF